MFTCAEIKCFIHTQYENDTLQWYTLLINLYQIEDMWMKKNGKNMKYMILQ